MRSSDAGFDPALATAAMRSVGESDVTTERLRHGDQFWGFGTDRRVVSFGWVTFRDRVIGTTRCHDREGRAFLYNFHTLQEWRGRGLYPALLTTFRHELGQAGIRELIIDANDHNRASIRGIERAGFQLAGEVNTFTLLSRIDYTPRSATVEQPNACVSGIFA